MENEQEEEVTQNVPMADQSPLAAESQRPQRVRRRPAWMYDNEVTGIDQFEDPLTLCFQIVILPVLKWLSKNQNGERLWMLK